MIIAYYVVVVVKRQDKLHTRESILKMTDFNGFIHLMENKWLHCHQRL